MNKLYCILAIALVIAGLISPAEAPPHDLAPIDNLRVALSWTALPESDWVNVTLSDETSGAAQRITPGAANTIVLWGRAGQSFTVQEYRTTATSLEPTRRWLSRAIPATYRFYLPV